MSRSQSPRSTASCGNRSTRASSHPTADRAPQEPQFQRRVPRRSHAQAPAPGTPPARPCPRETPTAQRARVAACGELPATVWGRGIGRRSQRRRRGQVRSRLKDVKRINNSLCQAVAMSATVSDGLYEMVVTESLRQRVTRSPDAFAELQDINPEVIDRALTNHVSRQLSARLHAANDLGAKVDIANAVLAAIDVPDSDPGPLAAARIVVHSPRSIAHCRTRTNEEPSRRDRPFDQRGRRPPSDQC